MLELTPEQLYELFTNLVYAGFNDKEALHIVTQVAVQYVQRANQMLVLRRLESKHRNDLRHVRQFGKG